MKNIPPKEDAIKLEQEKILIYLVRALNSKKLAELIEKMDVAINLFGKPISAEKHYFLRIEKSEDKLVLWGREEYIPKKDEKENWIIFPEEEINTNQNLLPTIELIPDNLRSEDFLKNFEKRLQEIKAYDEEYQLSYQDIQEIMADIKNEN